jgi:hypothetical protein
VLFADHIYNISLYASNRFTISYIPKLVAIYNDAGRSGSANDKNYFSDLPKIVYEKLGVVYAIYVWGRLFTFKTKQKLKKALKK